MPGKTIVIFSSKYGSTEIYARWIAHRLNADIFRTGDVKPKDLTRYDIIIFGGSLHAMGIKGISLIKKNFELLKGKKLAVFAVGCSPVNEENFRNIQEHNFPRELSKQIHLFYFRGKFDYEHLNFIDRTMMNMLRNMLLKRKVPLTDDEKALVECYEKPADWTDEKSIEPLIEYVKH